MADKTRASFCLFLVALSLVRSTRRAVPAIGGSHFFSWPVYGIDVSEKNLPQEVGRDRWAISYSKGCYLGQETVARIQSRGHVNRMLVGVRFQTRKIPVPGTELTADDGPAGRVTSATFSPCLGSALAHVRRANASVGAKLDSPLGPAEVISLPV